MLPQQRTSGNTTAQLCVYPRSSKPRLDTDEGSFSRKNRLGCRRKHKLHLGFASLPVGLFGGAKKVPGKRDIPVPSSGDKKEKEEEASKEGKPKDTKPMAGEKEDSKAKKPGKRSLIPRCC